MKSFGQFIREKRDEKDLSLRELARRAGVSAPFLSDIELGRRFPSDEVLEKLGAILGATVDELRGYDTRPPIEGLRRLAESNPKYGVAFRRIIDDGITPEDLIKLAEQRSKAKRR